MTEIQLTIVDPRLDGLIWLFGVPGTTNGTEGNPVRISPDE